MDIAPALILAITAVALRVIIGFYLREGEQAHDNWQWNDMDD